ncbi:hypothetical protein H4R35_005539 [Dimargaris xerosporica]|nr:hypothetical protein H4R35_005539 [Dimargaris xerosporica]
MIELESQCQQGVSEAPYSLVRCILLKITQESGSTHDLESLFYETYLLQSTILDLFYAAGSDVQVQLSRIIDVNIDSVIQNYATLTDDQLGKYLPLDYAVRKRKAALALLFWERWREILNQQGSEFQDHLRQLWALLVGRNPLDASEDNLAELEIALHEVHARNMLRLVPIAVLERNERLLRAHLQALKIQGHELWQLFSLALTWPRALGEPQTQEVADDLYRQYGPVVGVDKATDCMRHFGFTQLAQGLQNVIGNHLSFMPGSYPTDRHITIDECNDLLLLQPTATVTIPSMYWLPVHLSPEA